MMLPVVARWEMWKSLAEKNTERLKIPSSKESNLKENSFFKKSINQQHTGKTGFRPHVNCEFD